MDNDSTATDTLIMIYADELQPGDVIQARYTRSDVDTLTVQRVRIEGTQVSVIGIEKGGEPESFSGFSYGQVLVSRTL